MFLIYHYRKTKKFKKVGQNLWYGSSSSKEHPPGIPVKKAVEAWYAELPLYNAVPPKYNSNHASGHLTQLIWGETSKVGCGYSFYRCVLFAAFTASSSHFPAYNAII